MLAYVNGSINIVHRIVMHVKTFGAVVQPRTMRLLGSHIVGGGDCAFRPQCTGMFEERNE